MHSFTSFGPRPLGIFRPRAATRLAASLALGALLLLGQPGAGLQAQDRAATLADIRQQLTVLNVEIQGLKRELSTTGAPSQLATGGSQIDRMNALEAELRRLTARTEEMDHRIDRIVSDGTNRISDLEFRLVELEGGDLSQLGETSTLGGGDAGSETVISTPVAPAPTEGAPQLAISEEADFQAAADKLEAGDFPGALSGYETFKATYPGSPLSPAADLGRGRALEGQGEIKSAARAYLDAFSAAPKGDTAPEALHRLGLLLGQLGQQAESCVTLGEVSKRFPSSPWAAQATQATLDQGCG
ncbi:tol-pal system protein YbgF [Pseudooceanicola antarcticus]|uniref:Cell division coordinator CpoB n=1 Tax=Pseudooceanicola antarcticus TaxID=1247613 RepID=A0A285IVI2_9RHOB|nr:tetratricopeptide repeat protein [Pseudooceanicola antarcticus]SNY50941.1 tol-pal system protein YbgF [Pseudooceanicola antarcticus]